MIAVSKAIGLKNNNYWDSSSVVHNRKKLSDILNKGYCQMTVYEVKNYPSNVDNTVTAFGSPISFGGFVADVTNGRLIIPKGTKVIETSGMVCGSGYAHAYLKIVDENGNKVGNSQSTGILVQSAGNNYWKHSLPNYLAELDETKIHYIYLVVSGYNNQQLTLNNGFGYSSFIKAKKIR